MNKLRTTIAVLADTIGWMLTLAVMVLAPVGLGFSAGLVAGLIRFGWQGAIHLFN